ncbi:MAG: flagellar hook-length control protein FliK [Phycisphaerales bacterium JB050]
MSDRVATAREDSKQTEVADGDTNTEHDSFEDQKTNGVEVQSEDQPSDFNQTDEEPAVEQDEPDSDPLANSELAVQSESQHAPDTESPVVASEQAATKSSVQRSDDGSEADAETLRATRKDTGRPHNEVREAGASASQRQQGDTRESTNSTDSDAAGDQDITAAKAQGKSREGEAEHTRSDRRTQGESARTDSTPGHGDDAAEQGGTDNQSEGDRRDPHAEQSGQDRAGRHATRRENDAAEAHKPESLASLPASKTEASADAIKGESRAEPQSATQDTASARPDAPTQEAPQPAKLAGPSVADRLSQTSLNASDRAVLQARTDGDAVTNQAVARGMNAVLRQGGGALTMKLSPASLGEVRIEMSMQGGRVSLQFDVGNIAAYEAIKGQLGELKQSLEQRGMTVERVETHVSPALAKSSQPEQQSNQRGGEQSGQNEQQHQDAADGQSRGRADGGERGTHESGWDSPDGESMEMDFEQSLRLGLDAVA